MIVHTQKVMPILSSVPVLIGFYLTSCVGINLPPSSIVTVLQVQTTQFRFMADSMNVSYLTLRLQTVTAEVDACFALLLRVRREMRRTGDESSDHLLHLDSLVGRLNLQVYSQERFIVGKFDGWPQVSE